MIQPNDIAYFYSGGAGNMNADLSLGGLPSVHPIPLGSANNLFDNLTETQRNNGMTDYRCLYVANTHPTDSFYRVYAKIPSQIPGGASVEIGYRQTTEVQTVTFDSPPPAQYRLTYNNGSTTTNFDLSDTSSTNLQATLEPTFPGVLVTTSGNQLTIQFKGKSDYHYYSLLTTSTPGVATYKVTDGGPINYYPEPPLDSKYTPPGAITFGSTTLINGAEPLPELKHGEVFHLWAKRTLQPGTPQQDNDGFSLSVIGSVFS